MPKTTFDYGQDTGPKDKKHLKCNNCGHEEKINPNVSYEARADCRVCHRGQMMGWDWMGWKNNEARKKRLEEMEKRAKEPRESISQESEPFENFTERERNIKGLVTVESPGTEAPWMSPLGACLVKVFGIRRRNGRVEFGVGNEEPPILAWVTKDKFYDEWPD